MEYKIELKQVLTVDDHAKHVKYKNKKYLLYKNKTNTWH